MGALPLSPLLGSLGVFTGFPLLTGGVCVCVCETSFCSASFKDTLLNDIRKAREKYQGEELAKELSRIKLRIDNTEVLTQDIVMNLLFSYRDIQVLEGNTGEETLLRGDWKPSPPVTTRTTTPWSNWSRRWRCSPLVIWPLSP